MLSLLGNFICAALYARLHNRRREKPQIREPRPQLPKLGFRHWLCNWLLFIIFKSIHPLVLLLIIFGAHDCNVVLEDALRVFHSKLLAVRKSAWALQALIRPFILILVCTHLLSVDRYSWFNIGFVRGLVRLILLYSQPNPE